MQHNSSISAATAVTSIASTNLFSSVPTYAPPNFCRRMVGKQLQDTAKIAGHSMIWHPPHEKLSSNGVIVSGFQPNSDSFIHRRLDFGDVVYGRPNTSEGCSAFRAVGVDNARIAFQDERRACVNNVIATSIGCGDPIVPSSGAAQDYVIPNSLSNKNVVVASSCTYHNNVITASKAAFCKISKGTSCSNCSSDHLMDRSYHNNSDVPVFTHSQGNSDIVMLNSSFRSDDFNDNFDSCRDNTGVVVKTIVTDDAMSCSHSPSQYDAINRRRNKVAVVMGNSHELDNVTQLSNIPPCLDCRLESSRAATSCDSSNQRDVKSMRTTTQSLAVTPRKHQVNA